MATIEPVPPLPPELVQLARWLDNLRAKVVTGAVSGSDYISVKTYGAVGDGVTDDHNAIQAALNYATTNGGTVFFPAGTYVCNSALVMDTGTSWSRHGPRCSIKGAGSANTRLICKTANVQFLTVGGFGAQYYVEISDLYFQGPGTVSEGTGPIPPDGYGTGTALRIQASSWSRISNCVIRGWGTGVNITDTFSVMFDSTYIAANLNGVYLGTTIYAQPNAISFIACGVGENKNYGIYALLATTLTISGGSIEGNGVGGSGPFVGGIYVSGGPNGAAQVSMSGVYFEDNAGTADVWIDNTSSPGSSSFSGCTFNRIRNTSYVTNNIYATASAGMINKVSIQGCGFQGFNTYSPSAGRPYLNTSGTGAQMSWSACFFGSTVETPTISNYIAGGTGAASLLRVIYAGGVGTNTPTLPLSTCPSNNPGQWIELTSDGLVAAGVSGFWTIGVPA